jgi:predicted RNA binding protein YcfA (HicA-like mRNA interferase family)
MPYRPKEVLRALLAMGFVIVRITGSHHHLKKPDQAGLVTVPLHGKDLKTGTLKSILKQAGLTEEQLKKAL